MPEFMTLDDIAIELGTTLGTVQDRIKVGNDNKKFEIEIFDVERSESGIKKKYEAISIKDVVTLYKEENWQLPKAWKATATSGRGNSMN
ncbi:hypothetical protein [Hyphococcus sp.]|uniref:hypothetical protein n=1 Tax=Hyphococcus sp. TaxID=2038636 RepID=UPI003CCB902B